MEQEQLFHEDIYEALRTCVQALGGAKAIGSALWPEMPVDKAGNRLNDALNTAKRDVLNIEQVLFILTEARKINCHAGMYFITDWCDYKRPEPMEPADEMAELQREFIQTVEKLATMEKRLKHFSNLQAVING